MDFIWMELDGTESNKSSLTNSLYFNIQFVNEIIIE
jgi:hypothetical protein